MPSAGAASAARVLEISGQAEELLFMLFPHLRGLRVGQVEDTGDAVVIRACCRAAQARCPSGGEAAARARGGAGGGGRGGGGGGPAGAGRAVGAPVPLPGAFLREGHVRRAG